MTSAFRALLYDQMRFTGEFFNFFCREWTAHGEPSKAANPRAVFLIPGFMAGDASLYPLGLRLRAKGHLVFHSGLTCNAGCSIKAIEKFSAAIRSKAIELEQKLIVVGHSLGGIHARELGRRMPEYIERVILLGSGIKQPLSHSNPHVRMLFIASGQVHADGTSCASSLATLCGTHNDEPLTEVAETLVYSKSDAVVDWRACLESGPQIEAIEVESSHYGLPFHPAVLKIICERLASVEAPVSSNGSLGT